MNIKELEKQVASMLEVATEERAKRHEEDIELSVKGDVSIKAHDAALLNGMWTGQCYALEAVLQLINDEDLV